MCANRQSAKDDAAGVTVARNHRIENIAVVLYSVEITPAWRSSLHGCHDCTNHSNCIMVQQCALTGRVQKMKLLLIAGNHSIEEHSSDALLG